MKCYLSDCVNDYGHNFYFIIISNSSAGKASHPTSAAYILNVGEDKILFFLQKYFSILALPKKSICEINNYFGRGKICHKSFLSEKNPKPFFNSSLKRTNKFSYSHTRTNKSLQQFHLLIDLFIIIYLITFVANKKKELYACRG